MDEVSYFSLHLFFPFIHFRLFSISTNFLPLPSPVHFFIDTTSLVAILFPHIFFSFSFPFHVSSFPSIPLSHVS